ncbi:MAG: class I SAM-dependent methyltransferase [Cyclobacteriaceae bacterium]
MIRSLKPLFVLLIFITGLCGTLAQNLPSTSAGKSDYSFKTPSRDGTGKFYMGREISQVMGFHGMAWLERESRPEEENTALAIDNLPVTQESIVADIGAGSGYYTFRIAPKVPNGKVYAVEIQDEAIQYIRKKSKDTGQKNVEAIKGNKKSPNLPQNSLDLVIMVDVYHELSYPKEMLTEIKKSLKQDGKLLLIEYRGEDPEVAIKPLHKMTVKQVNKELSANGFKLVKNGQFMNIQHFLVFQKD